jgi:mono/diheme cytochrome c family protein
VSFARGTFVAAALFGAVAGTAWAEDSSAAPAGAAPSPAEMGGDIYGTRCILCHGRSGGRGPNLFHTKLSEDQFVYTAINGRKGTQMPAFGTVLSPDDIAAVYAFVESRDSAF